MADRPMVPAAVHASHKSNLRPEYVIDEKGCWVWQRATDRGGYGKVTRRGKSYGAHVMYWEAAHGPIPVGLEPDHVVCSNRLCVNPAHMELVTRSENVRRGWRNGGQERRNREHANRSAGQYRAWAKRRAGE